MGVPQLHVGAVSRIANIEGVKEQEAGVAARLNSLRQASPSKPSHLLQIRQDETRIGPLCVGKLGRANFNSILVIGGIVASDGATTGVNLAAVSKVIVHGTPPASSVMKVRRTNASICDQVLRSF